MHVSAEVHTKPPEWTDLFATGDDVGEFRRVKFRVLRKRGEPLLILPGNNRCAAQAMQLYAAQTLPARLARGFVRAMLTAGIPLIGDNCELNVAADQPFLKFLRELSGADGLPPLAILNGNPRPAGRRFVSLVFDVDANPRAVVKAGIGPAAAELIRKEATFLNSLPQRKSGIPAVRAGCVSGPIAAFAMDFAPGDSPRDNNRVAELLTDWVDRGRKAVISELPQWRELAASWSGESLFITPQKQLAAKTIHPVISHGDFAPWNIKVAADNSWVVLDWERGELNGVPAWDWFHFLIQPQLLVRRRPAAEIAGSLEALLTSREFRAYADVTGIAGMEPLLLQGYLAFMLRVIRPSEGLVETEALLNCVAKRRRPDA